MELCSVAAMMGWLAQVYNGVVAELGMRTRLCPGLDPHTSIFGMSVLNQKGYAPSNLNRSQNTVSNSQVLAHSCLSSSGKRST